MAKIKRIKQPDIVKYQGKNVSVKVNGNGIILESHYTEYFYLSVDAIRELIEVLPEFLKELDK